MAFNLDNIFGFLGKYANTIGNVVQGVTAVQSYLDQRDAEKETKKANAALMKSAEADAALAKQDAALRADAARRDATRARAQQISAYLKSGVTLDGSPMLVTDETGYMGKRNADNILENAGYQSRSIMLRAEASKRSVKKADIWGTGFNVLGSAAGAADAYNKAKKGG
jgi:hypothetical protein